MKDKWDRACCTRQEIVSGQGPAGSTMKGEGKEWNDLIKETLEQSNKVNDVKLRYLMVFIQEL